MTTSEPSQRRPPAALLEADAEARYARDRLTLARRREVLGRGRPGRVAELERAAAAADDRLRRVRTTTDQEGA